MAERPAIAPHVLVRHRLEVSEQQERNDGSLLIRWNSLDADEDDDALLPPGGRALGLISLPARRPFISALLPLRRVLVGMAGGNLLNRRGDVN